MALYPSIQIIGAVSLGEQTSLSFGVDLVHPLVPFLSSSPKK